MKKLYIIATCWLLSGIAFAQQDLAFVGRTQASYDSIFSELDWNKVTTGVLVEKTIILSKLDAYSGIGNLDTSSIASWRQMYLEYYNASIDRSQILTLEEYTAKAYNYMLDNQKFPLVMLAYNYNKFVSNAIEGGLLEVDSINTHKFYDRAGDEPLYTQSRVFSVALPVHGWNNGVIPIYISREFLFGNQELPENLEIDFGDGKGFINVEFDQTYEIAWEEGEHVITVRYSIDDEVIVAHSSVNRTSNITILPNQALGLVASRIWPGEYAAKAIAWIKWGVGNNSGKFRKPLVFVEGIDFSKERVPIGNQPCLNYFVNATGPIPLSNFQFYTCGQNNLRNGEAGWNELVEYNEDYKSLEKMPELRAQLEQQGYDIVYLDFNDGAGLIQNNAMVLVELLEWINDPVNRNPDESAETIVLGASMGGQVARFALHYMEQNSLCHNALMYVSFDSPHRGANVPLGLQYMIADLASLGGAAEEAKNNLLRPAARQMLVLHFSGDYTLRNAWQAWQNSANSYPQNLRKIAVANGSRKMVPSSLNPGARIAETNFTGSTFIGNKRCFALKGVSIYGHNNVIYRDGNGLFSSAVTKTANSSWPEYDSTPGCIGRFAATLDKGASGALFNVRKYECPFMPTISTLDVRAAYGNQNNLLDNVNLLYDIGTNILNNIPQPNLYPFDAYFAPDVNEPHVQITDGLATSHPGKADKWDENSYKPGPNGYYSNNIAWLMGQLQILENSTPNPSLLPVAATPTSPAINLFNFGSTIRNQLRSITIQSGGELYVNKNAAISGFTPITQAQPGTFQLNTIPGCPVYVQLNTSNSVPGKMVLGDDTNNNYKSEVFFKSGSILNLNGGKLVINNNSRLVIEEGATLIFNPNSVIELNGDNAVLEIRGNLNIAPNATFTFTKASTQASSGFVRLHFTQGRRINVAQSSRIELRGQGITDKIVEVTAGSLVNHTNWDLAGYIIENGKVEMGSGSEWALGNTITVNNVHFTGTLLAKYKTISTTNSADEIKNSKFTYGETGLTLMQWNGEQSLLTNNIFANNLTSLRTVNGNVKINSCQFNTSQTGWKMEAGSISEVNNSIFQNYDVGINYISNSGGVLSLNQTIINDNDTGVIFDGPGTLRGHCSTLLHNFTGAKIKNTGYVDFSGTSTVSSGMDFNNYSHNILFDKGAGLDFQNGKNQFICDDADQFYKLSTSPGRGTAGISGEIIGSVLDPAGGTSHYNPAQLFYADKNSWNLDTPAEPFRKQDVTTYNGTFDYSLYSSVGSGIHPPTYYYKIEDNSPMARRNDEQQQLLCGSVVADPGDGGNARLSSRYQASCSNFNSVFTGTSQCTQYQALLQGVQQAFGQRTCSNPNGNDFLAFTSVQSALQVVQPDTCREFNELLGQAYRLMREAYVASLVTDTVVTANYKLNLANQITDIFLNWNQVRADTSGMYYMWMDKALNSYAAEDLQQANWALNNARNYADAANANYVQYWTCLLNARRQFQDSTITATEFFELLDNCQGTYETTRVARKTDNNPALVQNSLKIYPNPAESATVVNFELKQAEPVIIELLDINGTVLETIHKEQTIAGKQEVTMPLGKRQNGIYFIRVYGKKFNQATRLSIIK